MIQLLKSAARGIAAARTYGAGWIAGPIGGGFGFGGITSTAGKRVSSQTALTHSAVWDCVRKTAEMVSSLPVDHYRKGRDGSRDKVEDDLAEIVKVSPNSEQTSAEFWEGMVAAMVLQGNGYAERLFVGSRLVGLRPLLACTPERTQEGAFRYNVLDRGKRETLPADKVFHLRGFGAGDGLGMSAIRYGANSIGAALAGDETAGAYFSNAAMPAGVLQSEQRGMTPEQSAQMQDILDRFTGSRKAGKAMFLPAGFKWQQMQMNPEDAQLLETRRFAIEDVCRWFGVPPIVIGHAAEGQTMWGSGVEAILLSWLTLGVNPLLIRLEQRLAKDLLAPGTRRREYFEYNREAMIQMDSRAKGDLMLKLGAGGTMTANERRQRLNLSRHPDPNADALLAQAQMTPLELLGRNDT